MKPKPVVKIDDNVTTKKVYFGDDGQIVDKPIVKKKPEKLNKIPAEETETSEVTEEPNHKFKKGFKKHQQSAQDLGTKWYQVHEEHNTSEFKDIKDSELNTLQQLCRSSFNDEIQKLTKSKSILLSSRPCLINSYF